MSIRIDPLTKAGTFDHEFYASEEYTSIRDVTLAYLCAEGFDREVGEYNVIIQDQCWYVTVK